MFEIHNKSWSKDLRKQLRKNQTKAERLLWSRLKKKQTGFRFRRQHGIEKYIVDFYCTELDLVIELDGSGHFEEEQITKDKIRQDYLEDLGMTVVRFTNDKVERDLEGVIEVIRSICDRLVEVQRNPSALRAPPLGRGGT